MFSWACKGCGHDLKSGELVRMNGCKGTYDGYGGNSGGFDHENCAGEPVCWHERCYGRANTAERDDETPSKNASNQGFGWEALEFLKGYKEQGETTYTVEISTTTGTYPDLVRHEFHPVREGDGLVLLDHKAYKRAWDNYDDGADLDNMTEEEEDSWSKGLHTRFEAETGLKNPKLNRVVFASLDEAKKAADHLVRDIQEYHLLILGVQGDLRGQCYERERRMKYRRSADGNLEPTGEYREEVVYEQGVKNENQKNRLATVLFGDE
jgi:hypothetical protein